MAFVIVAGHSSELLSDVNLDDLISSHQAARHSRPHGLRLYSVYLLSFLSFSSSVLVAHGTEVNQNLPHVQK